MISNFSIRDTKVSFIRVSFVRQKKYPLPPSRAREVPLGNASTNLNLNFKGDLFDEKQNKAGGYFGSCICSDLYIIWFYHSISVNFETYSICADRAQMKKLVFYCSLLPIQ